MSRLAESGSTRSRCASSIVEAAARHPSISAAGMADSILMPASAMAAGAAIPRLMFANGQQVPTEHRLVQGEQAAARLAVSLLQAGIANEIDWERTGRNAFEYIKCSLNEWLSKFGCQEIQKQFFLDVVLSTSLDRYSAGSNDGPDDISRVFITVEPDSAGYVVLGPTLRLLEDVPSPAAINVSSLIPRRS